MTMDEAINTTGRDGLKMVGRRSDPRGITANWDGVTRNRDGERVVQFSDGTYGIEGTYGDFFAKA